MVMINFKRNKVRFFLLLWITAWLNLSVKANNNSGNQNIPSELKIVTFNVNATPPVGSRLAYDPMINSSDLSLRAKGIILIGAGKPIVMCAIDWIGIANESQDLFKMSLAETVGTIPERVVVHTVHQHDAPISDLTAEKILTEHKIPLGAFESSFIKTLIRDIQCSIRSSLPNAECVTDIGVGKAPVYKVASNRRVNKQNGKIVSMRGSSSKDMALRNLPEGLIDPDVSLLSFWNNDKPLAILSFYATHPQSYYLTKIADPDFPGIARFLRQLAVPDALHVHFTGAAGNIAAGKYNDGSHQARFVLAERMADGMKRAWENTEKYKVDAKNIYWTTEPLFLPYNPDVAKIEDQISKMSERHLSNNLGRLGWYKRRLEGKCIEAACLAINDARILFMPGELFVEYQLAAKSMAPNKFVAMAAYGDYGPFYIGTQEAYGEGGYEIESSPVTVESEKYILDAVRTLLKKADNRTGLLRYIDKKGNQKEVRTKKEWEKRRKEILENMQEVMGALPHNNIHNFDLVYTDSVKRDRYIRYSINFQAAPSERVYAYLYKPVKVNTKYPAVLALHSTGSRGKEIIDDENSLTNRGYASELAERGYVVISPDYPSFGEQTDYDFNSDRYVSGTMKGIYNHISCVSFLQSLNYVDKDRIGVVGHSLGGHNTIFVASFDPRIKVVVSSCGWTLMDYYNAGENVTKNNGGRLGPWAQDRYMPLIRTNYNLDSKLLPFDFDEIIATIAPRPFFTSSPLYDRNFSIEGVRQGIENISEVYSFLNASDKLKALYPNCGHDFPPEIRNEAYNFIDKFLK